MSFDLSACSNSDMMTLTLEGALAAGWPSTQSLYVWACVNKEMRNRVRALISPLLATMTQKTKEWKEAAALEQQASLQHAKFVRKSAWTESERTESVVAQEESLRAAKVEASNGQAFAAVAMGRALCALLSRSQANRVVNLQSKTGLGGLHDMNKTRDVLWHGFSYDWTLIAHICLELCMACSGKGVRCHHTIVDASGRPPRGNHIGDFCFPCGQDAQLMFAKEVCLEWQSIIPFPEGLPDGPLHRLDPLKEHALLLSARGERRDEWTMLLARAMLNARDIYSSPGQHKYFLPSPSGLPVKPENFFSSVANSVGYAKQRQLLFLGPNRYVPPLATLAGRLGLTPEEVADAEAQARRGMTLRDREASAIKALRIDKARQDVDAYVRARMPGADLTLLGFLTPAMHAYLERVLQRREDQQHISAIGFAMRYRSVLEDMSVRSVVDGMLDQARERTGAS
jgi:hypothetical protein